MQVPYAVRLEVAACQVDCAHMGGDVWSQARGREAHRHRCQPRHEGQLWVRSWALSMQRPSAFQSGRNLCGRWTALMWAAMNGHTDVAAALIFAGADISAAGNDGCGSPARGKRSACGSATVRGQEHCGGLGDRRKQVGGVHDGRAQGSTRQRPFAVVRAGRYMPHGRPQAPASRQWSTG
jgi:hypothetical protein